MAQGTLVEPPACFGAFSAEADGHHYSWRGNGPGRNSTSIGIYWVKTEKWTRSPTTETPPPGLWRGGCVSLDNYLYCFGGYDGSSRFNDLHKLDIETFPFKWSKVPQENDALGMPIRKHSCGLVAVDEKTLGCFGGYGIRGFVQPGSTFTDTLDSSDSLGWTNEFHLFDVEKGTTIVVCQFINS